MVEGKMKLVRRSAHYWYVTSLQGALLILVGFTTLLYPFASTFALGLYFGCAMIAFGVLSTINNLGAARNRGHSLDLFIGGISIAAGLLALLDPFAGAFSLLWALGLWLAIGGILKLMTAFRTPTERLPLILTGVVDLMAALVLARESEALGVSLLSLLIAVSLVTGGLASIRISARLRRLNRRFDRLGPA
ncbi:HdeD family acid-resistance protein [Sphingomonas sp. TDK1]|uniref:HdeD family acid-resistance protein n=1 Tax=Sphingomonas sp. TDK1 TaxID=453247 RepID=UPI0007D9BB94|nr:DUF308 domain-containing protein [Sphingomonas sp. TDK1]OAN57573.1 hypothetical protein A7X12_06795 [Sphingomonas sp. TDK1]